MTYHQTIIIGNIGNEPELAYLQSGTAVCKMSVAVNEQWTKDGEKQNKTTWYRVSVWGKQGETAHKYLEKGRQVMVVGTVEASAYMGKDGTPQASLELRASEVKFLQSGTGGNEAEPSNVDRPDFGKNAPQEDTGDIPF